MLQVAQKDVVVNRPKHVLQIAQKHVVVKSKLIKRKVYMKKIILLVIANLSLIFASYSVGQTVSISDQQISRDVCYASDFDSNYNVGDAFSLYNLNGLYNGGQYHVIFLDMSATW
mgnify:FL=1